jgi:hypothetical protein
VYSGTEYRFSRWDESVNVLGCRVIWPIKMKDVHMWGNLAQVKSEVSCRLVTVTAFSRSITKVLRLLRFWLFAVVCKYSVFPQASHQPPYGSLFLSPSPLPHAVFVFQFIYVFLILIFLFYFLFIYLPDRYTFLPHPYFISYMVFFIRPSLTVAQPCWLSSRLLITPPPPRTLPFRIYVTILAFFPSRTLDRWRWDRHVFPKRR